MSRNTSSTNLIIGAVIFVVILLFGFIILGNNDSSNTTNAQESSSAGELTFSEKNWDFGEISMQDGNVTKEVLVTNNSDSPVTITRLETSCMCTKAQVIHEDGTKSDMKGMVGHGGSPSLSETIMPGESATLSVVFDPNAHGPNGTGPISRQVILETNSSDQQEVTLRFSGNVVK